MTKTIRCIDHYGKWHEIPKEKFVFRASAYGVLQKGKTILMVKDRWANKWEFPGGGVLPYEMIEDGLKREFKEETGFVIKVKRFITLQEHYFYAEDRNEAWHSIRFMYEVTNVGGLLKDNGNGDDIVRAAFLSQKEITKENTKAPIYSFVSKIWNGFS